MAASHHPPTADRRQAATTPPRREPFASYWLLVAIFGATLFALWLLFPKTYIENTLRTQARPDVAMLAYLQLLVRANPGDPGTRRLLAEKALVARNLPLARSALAPWQNRPIDALPVDIARLQLALLQMELLAEPAGTPARRVQKAAYITALNRLAPLLSAPQLLEEARFAQDVGLAKTVVLLDRMILRRSNDIALHHKAYSQGIAALLAAGTPRMALDFARTEISRVAHNDALWRRLIHLALAADRPDLAARYARRLVGMGGGPA